MEFPYFENQDFETFNNNYLNMISIFPLQTIVIMTLLTVRQPTKTV